MKKFLYFVPALCAALGMASCSNDDNFTEPEPELPPYVWTPGNWSGSDFTKWSFAKGADVSYVTQMEDEGFVFNHPNLTPGECMAILRDDCGVNAIRLRVWVNPLPMNPSTGKIYNDLNDVLKKAIRANNLELGLMIDFHLSDYWADPGQQTIPSAWQGLATPEQMTVAIKNHITEVLTALKNKGITPQWVQLGNEVSWGMLWDPKDPSGSPISGQPQGDNFNTPQHKNFATYVQAAYDAVKAVNPNICTIVHVDKGQMEYPAKWIFNILKYYNVSYDMIGLSLYPSHAGYKKGGNLIGGYVQPAINNAKALTKEFGKPVIFAEVGMPWDDAEGGALLIQTIMNAAKTDNNICGIFYWEPEVNPQWEAEGNGTNGYTLGAFNPYTNSPTGALAPFLTNID